MVHGHDIEVSRRDEDSFASESVTIRDHTILAKFKVSARLQNCYTLIATPKIPNVINCLKK